MELMMAVLGVCWWVYGRDMGVERVRYGVVGVSSCFGGMRTGFCFDAVYRWEELQERFVGSSEDDETATGTIQQNSARALKGQIGWLLYALEAQVFTDVQYYLEDVSVFDTFISCYKLTNR